MEWAEPSDSSARNEVKTRAWDNWLQTAHTADGHAEEALPPDVQYVAPSSSDDAVKDSAEAPEGLTQARAFKVEEWTDRGDVLASYPLDDESAALASKVGRDLANAVPQNWGDMDEAERMRMADAIYWTIKDELAPNAGAPMPGGKDVRPEKLGWTRGQDVHFNRNLLSASEPNDLIMTLIHEYRHTWQNDVAVGNLTHPLGADGRAQIVDALNSYDDDLFQDYGAKRNLLELDAERFALDACRSLTEEWDTRGSGHGVR